MQTLILPIKKQWFDMILNGIKTEEYREIKPYWENRFLKLFEKDIEGNWSDASKTIIFRNGYGNNKPQFSAECSLREDIGKQEWGAEANTIYFVLSIHRIFDIKNN